MERDLYTFTGADGNKRDDVENAFARTEADAGELTRRLAAGGALLIEERHHYASFVANMIIRTKAFQARLTETLRRHFGLTVVRPEHLHAHALMHMMKLGQIISHMSWSVIRTSGDARFLTSDDPVSIALFRLSGLPDSNCSILDKGATLTLPLAMNACLVAEWRDPPAVFQVLEADHPLIGMLNQKCVASAHENIFAPEQSLLPKPDNTAALRLAHPRPSLLHRDDVELLPPHGLRLPGVFDWMVQLMFEMRDTDLPTEPIR